MNEPWRITLLGGLRAKQGQEEITRFYTYKAGALLAYLAFYRERAHPREVLIALLWPEAQEKAGRASLSTALSSLRNRLEPPGTSSNSVLRADRFSIGFHSAAAVTDVSEFEAALRAARAGGISTAERRTALERAVRLYAGPLLPGFYEEWITAEQERLAGLFFDASSHLIEGLEAEGKWDAALAHARRAVAFDPLREEAQAQMLRLLAATGQTTAALRQYQLFVHRLDAELGDEPSAGLRALACRLEKERECAAPYSNFSGTSISGINSWNNSLPPGQPRQPRTMTFLLISLENTAEKDAGASRGEENTTFGEWQNHTRTLLQEELTRYGGQVIDDTSTVVLGERGTLGLAAAFFSAGNALAYAVACRQVLATQDKTSEFLLKRVRIALHTGDVLEQWQSSAGAGGRAADETGECLGATLLRYAGCILAVGQGGQTLLSESTAALVRNSLPHGTHLVDRGVWLLPSEAARSASGVPPIQERLFQVDYSGVASAVFEMSTGTEVSFPAEREPCLPLTFTRFFGRERETKELAGLLRAPDCRLITITGPGGTGKTRLAIETARQLAGEFPEGIWFVPLANLSDPALIPGAILKALGTEDQTQGRESLEQVAAILKRHQPSLLVLDNFEHLIEGSTEAAILDVLCQRVPALTLLVTSRCLLGRSGERTYSLSPLPTPNGISDDRECLPERLSMFDCVRMFVDRAQAVRPDFQITSYNASAVAELCDRLEGIPLAIELAAARAQAFTPAQMLVQIGKGRFEFLAGRRRNAADTQGRQRTLRAALDWSFRLLTPELQRFFCRLSVFRGGWTPEAAEEVCEEPLALDYLAQLQEASMVFTREHACGMRFSMLETLREYASEQLPIKEMVALATRHLRYYLGVAEQAQAGGSDPIKRQEYLDSLEVEQDNFRAALSWQPPLDYPETLSDNKDALLLTKALFVYWRVCGYWTEGRQWCEQALANSKPGPFGRRADVLVEAGWFATALGDFPAARVFHEEALAIYQARRDQIGAAATLHRMSNAAMEQGDWMGERSLLEESLAICEAVGDREKIARTLLQLGQNATNSREHDRARELFQQALALFEEGQGGVGKTNALSYLSRLASARRDYSEARRLREQAVAALRHLGEGFRQNLGHALAAFGEVLTYQGDYAAARVAGEEAVEIYRALGDRWHITYGLDYLGNAAASQKDFAAARSYFAESLALRRQLGNLKHVTRSLRDLALVAHLESDYEKARSLLGEAVEICRKTSDMTRLAGALTALAAVETDAGNLERARTYLAESLTLLRTVKSDDQLQISLVLDGYGRLSLAEGLPQRAARLWGATEALRKEANTLLEMPEKQLYDGVVSAAVAILGEELFAASVMAGRVMPVEKVIEYATESSHGLRLSVRAATKA